jgi:hypothetical protein
MGCRTNGPSDKWAVGLLGGPAYGSLTLTPEQHKYCTTRKELLAIIRFSRQFRHYLLGRHFTVRTDHNSLTWLMNFILRSRRGNWPDGLKNWVNSIWKYSIGQGRNIRMRMPFQGSLGRTMFRILIKKVPPVNSEVLVDLKNIETSERHFKQYFSYIVAVSFIGGNRSTRRTPPTCRKSLLSFIT